MSCDIVFSKAFCYCLNVFCLISLITLLTFFNILSNVNAFENISSTYACTYTFHPEINYAYGEFSYQLFTSYDEVNNLAFAHLQIHPAENIFKKSGSFEVLIDDLPVNIYKSPDISSQGFEIIMYSKNSNDIHLWFKLDFYNTDAEIKILHSEENSLHPLNIIFNALSYCPPCEKAFMITPLLPSEYNRKIYSRPVNTGIVINIPFQGAFEGAYDSKPGRIDVKGPQRCGNWVVETYDNWINIVYPQVDNDGKARGFGNDIVIYEVLRNEERKERSGVIKFSTQDNREIATFPVYQKDKILSKIWINELDSSSPLFNPELHYPIINENQEVKFSLAAQWNDGSITKVDTVNDDISWYIDSPDYADIYPSGLLSSKFIKGADKEVFVFVSYSYQSGNSVITRRTQAMTMIRDTSIVEDLIIEGDESVEEGELANFLVTATISNEMDTIVTKDISWSVDPPQYANIIAVKQKLSPDNTFNYYAELKASNVIEDTTIKLTASYNNKGIITSESINILIKDTTVLEKIVIYGKSNIKNNELAEYIAKAYWSNEPLSYLNDNIRWTLDTNDYLYAYISLVNGNLTPDEEKIGNSTQNITVSAQFNYSGPVLNEDSKRAYKDVTINGTTNWDFNISSPYSSFYEGENTEITAYIRINNGSLQNVTNDALWSIEPSDIAAIVKGNLVIGQISSECLSESIYVKACYEYLNTSRCDVKKFLVYDSTELVSLTINGPNEIIAANTASYSAIVKWTNISDQNYTDKVQWSVEPSEYASLISQGRLLALPVEEEQQVKITASYIYNDSQAYNTKTVTIIPGIYRLEIVGDNSIIDDNTVEQFKAIALWKDGSSANVTDKCHWNVIGSAVIETKGDNNPGKLIPNDIDGDQRATITAAYTFGEDDQITKIDKKQIILKDKTPKLSTISGTIFYNGSQNGTLVIEAYSVSDTAYSNTVAKIQKDWPLNSSQITYQINIPIMDTYNLIAFIDIDNNNQMELCEAWGNYNEVISENNMSDINITLSVSSGCSTAGVAIDMSTTTNNYLDSILFNDIETEVYANVNNEITIGVIAQNVLNLDTFQVELEYNPSLLKYIEDSEKEGDFLKKHDGVTIGFQVSEKIPGILNIANSLIGSENEIAPDGSGLLAEISFKVLVSASSSQSKIQIKPFNVFFINSLRETEQIFNLSKSNIYVNPLKCEDQPWDFNKDGIVNFMDLNIFADHWMFMEDNELWDLRFNLNPAPDIEFNKQIINYKDLIAFSIHWLEETSCVENNKY